MSIKKLFESENNRNYLSDKNVKDAFKGVESGRNASALKEKQDSFLPQIDYSDPANFARYGSAYLYYKSAFERIHDYYPYDGSSAEKTEFYNKSLDIEKYIFDKVYPSTTGYVTISQGGWGSQSSISGGYGVPAAQEYITFFGGPGTASSQLGPDPYSDIRQFNNIYDTTIYTSEGLITNYGSGSRESNLKSNFDNGVTVEFWLKTGSMDGGDDTFKQVVFDMWNNESSASADYGRITIEVTGADQGDASRTHVNGWNDSPFLLTVQSGSRASGHSELGAFQQKIGTGFASSSLGNWGHYAITIYNSGSDLRADMFVNGILNDRRTFADQSLGELSPKNMVGRVGALLAQPSASYAGGSGAGKLNGSIDEFRFWKTQRTPEEIGRNWFTTVNGGVNTDVSNAELGMYYKFNEGVTGDNSIDAIVLDYGGRVCNGTWTGYSSNSRNTGSAMVSASAAAFEKLDPIIRSNHPDVIARKASLLSSGSYHDSQNNANLASLVPAWILEEHETKADNKRSENNLELITHIMGAYFDKLFLQIEALPTFKQSGYTSGSHKPLPFSQHLPQSLGLATPELFIDSTVMEKFANRNENSQFENDLNDTKNLIYSNLYNNIAGIYKAKGTEKAIKNVFRCFNIDDRLIKMNTYSNNQVYTIKNNLKQITTTKKSLNFDKLENIDAVVYQRENTDNNESRGFLAGQVDGNQYRYGFTAEANVFFPTFTSEYDLITRNFDKVSIFGMQMVHTGNIADTTADTADGGKIEKADSMDGTNTSWLANDDGNFQVYAVRDASNSKNVKFVLESLHSDVRPFPKLESDTFFDVYDNSSWNLSVRLKPSNYPFSHVVSGSGTYTFDLIFQGYNTELGVVKNSFTVSKSISQVSGSNFIKAGKRLHLGAYRKNVTGAFDNDSRMKSDINVSSTKVWTRYIEDNALLQHSADINNLGITGSFQNISPKDSNSDQCDILNINTLMLAWNFDNVTQSDASGNFYTVDVSSGSANLRNNRGWVGNIAGYQHTGYGFGFITSSTDVLDVRQANAFVTQDPELVLGSDMVQIVDDTDYYFGTPQDVPNFYYTFEKSMYAALSEEMMHFFAGILDFNNLIGHPVNRYRENYKDMENLRRIFFERVNNVTEVERFIEYYKWFDDAIITVIEQMMPASSDSRADITDTIESHVLERNKYKTKYPTLNILGQPMEGVLIGLGEKIADYRLISTPLPSSPRKAKKKEGEDIYPVRYWKERAERSSEELTSGDAALDDIRDKIKTIVASKPFKSGTLPTLRTPAGTAYKVPTYRLRNLSMPFQITIDSPLGTGSYLYKGGTNFRENKNIHFTYDALRPAGPINQDNEAFIPLNVLLAHASEVTELPEYFKASLNKRKKIKRYFKVHHGRNWEEGKGYKNTKSSYAFPFNIISSSVSGGFNDEIKAYFTGGIELTNLHHDTYGDDQEVPLQGPFTNYAVGGHQSRHISLNTGSDNWLNRPEAWKILVGRCVNGIRETGSLGMVGPDYPYPESNDDRVTVVRKTREGLTNNKGIVWPAPADAANVGNCLVIPSTGSDSQNAAWALLFDNNMTGSASEFPTWTFSAWINPSASNAARSIWSAGSANASGDAVHHITIEGDETLRYALRTSTNAGAGSARQTFWETAQNAITNGSWNHIAVSLTGTIGNLSTTVKPTLYINGVSQSWDGTTSPSNTPYNNLPTGRKVENNFRDHADLDINGPVLLGGYLDSAGLEEYGGAMDEVAMWNVQLSNAEITEIYNGGVPTNLSHSSAPQYEYLSAWWRMGEGDGTSADNVNTGAAAGSTISANNIVRDLVSTASLLPVAKSGDDINLFIGYSSLTGAAEISDSIKVGPMPYPVSASQKAVYYRDHIAKRPVNFKNIQLKTSGPTHNSLGNYRKNYEVVQSHGAFVNNRRFLDEQPLIPSASRRYGLNFTDIVGFVNNLHRGEAGHFDYDIEYRPNQFTGSENKTVFISRFRTPGAPETMTRAYQDLRGAEYSVYNTLNYRNLTVRRPNQGPTGAISVGSGEQGFGNTTVVAAQGVPGMRVYDIHTRDFGLTSHYARHTAKFGRDSVTLPNMPYDLKTAFTLNLPEGSHTYDASGSLQAWWRLDTDISDGSDAADSSGNGRTGDSGGGTASKRPGFTAGRTPNEFLQAGSCNFDGVDDLIEDGSAATWDDIIGNDTSAGSTEKMTFAAWVFPESSGENTLGRILDFGSGDITMRTEVAMKLVFQSKWNGNNAVLWATNASAMPVNQWTHIAVTYDATDASNDPVMYVNGAVAASSHVSGSKTGAYYGIVSQDTVIGGNLNADRTWDGNLADVSVWNDTISAENIKTLYKLGSQTRENQITAMSIPEPGSDVNQLPGFHKTHRNNIRTLRKSGSLIISSSRFDNYFIQHAIPRSSTQYSWITKSITSDNDFYGHPPANFMISQSLGRFDGYDEAYTFRTASSVGSRQTAGERTFGFDLNNPRWAYTTQYEEGSGLPVNFAGLNINIREPVTASTNTLGYPSMDVKTPHGLAVGTVNYANHNHDFIEKVFTLPTAKGQGAPAMLNSIINHRDGPYGYPTWKANRRHNHPVLREERKRGEISMITSGNHNLRHYELRPVSLRGRPLWMNLSRIARERGVVKTTGDAFTVQASHDNELIGFNDVKFNDEVLYGSVRPTTPFDQVSRMAAPGRGGYRINWVLYKQNIFPSFRNEFSSSIRERLNYDNFFWRDQQDQRIALTKPTSESSRPSYAPVNAPWALPKNYSQNVSFDPWPLSAPQSFLTRSHVPPLARFYNSYSNARYYGRAWTLYLNNLSGTAAGLLQNHFSSFHTGSDAILSEYPGYTTFSQKYKMTYALRSMLPSPLYSRKHVVAAPWSVVAPTGIDLYRQFEEGQHRAGIWSQGANFLSAASVPLYAGEAYWDAAATAGVVTKTSSLGTGATVANNLVIQSKFVSHSSAPWYNDYDDFKYDVRLLSKDYAIVPEFRISSHVDDYIKYGLNNPSKTDTYEIPGTIINSSTSSFYKDYSNSQFLEEFLRIKSNSMLRASEIRLVCSAAIKFNPYKGFYPAQRTIDLFSQFSSSYANGLRAWWEYSWPTPDAGEYTYVEADSREIINERGGCARPVLAPLFAPGIMYNSIKSGLAVDYPTVLDADRYYNAKFGGASTGSIRAYPNPSQVDGPTLSENNYAIVPAPNTTENTEVFASVSGGYGGGPYFDLRLPFETIIRPSKYIDNVEFIDLEPHPSMSLQVTASISMNNTDDLYELMAKNFFGEVPNFFLKDSKFTSLESDVLSNDLKFPEGSVYGARLSLARSMRGMKTYQYDSGSSGDSSAYTNFGGRVLKSNGQLASDSAWYPIPQDPKSGYEVANSASSDVAWADESNPYRETFTMYSRPTAFGPEAAGRPMSASNGTLNNSPWLSASMSGCMDSFNGFNWAYTPPYYHGQAWCDFIFIPDHTKTYDVETILSEIKTRYWRVDPGPIGPNGLNTLIAGGPPVNYTASNGNTWSVTGAYNVQQPIYSGFNVNDNAMQLSASFNLFGVERVLKQKRDKFGNIIESANETAGMRWVIQPKFETPMLNFNDTGVHPILPDSTMTMPLYATASVPRGMWHQFGNIPEDSSKGIFVDIGDIPPQWLKYHYDVISTGSVYNNFQPKLTGSGLHKNMKSLTDLFGFQRKETRQRLGEIKEKHVMYEAIVAVPYVLETIDVIPSTGLVSPLVTPAELRKTKKFISIPEKRIEATTDALLGSPEGDSLTAAGLSIRKLTQKLGRYVLPPEIDFINNKNIDPMVMYMFEFSYELDKDDLSYIWQNLAPRNFRELSYQHASTAHTLGPNELLSNALLSENPNMRWMVFKIKQRAEDNYYNKVVDQAGASSGEAIYDDLKTKSGYQLGYNWPYDYLSFVEMIKIDAEILMVPRRQTGRLADESETPTMDPATALVAAISEISATTTSTMSTPSPVIAGYSPTPTAVGSGGGTTGGY